MKIHSSVPRAAIDGWQPTDVNYPVGSGSVGFHYHDVGEWLQLLEGTMTFFTLRDHPYAVATGGALNIDPGEVHRVEIGPEGARYRMWLLVDMSGKTFQHKLEDEDVVFLKKNLDLPESENRWDQRGPEATVVGNADAEVLDNFTSAELVFRNAKGEYLGKKAYLKRPPAPVTRIPSDTVCILYKDTQHLLLSTVVQTKSFATGAREFYSNTRFFVKEDGLWKCRVWLNLPEPVSS